MKEYEKISLIGGVLLLKEFRRILAIEGNKKNWKNFEDSECLVFGRIHKNLEDHNDLFLRELERFSGAPDVLFLKEFKRMSWFVSERG